MTESFTTWMPLLVSAGALLVLVMLASGIVAFAPKSAFEPFRRLAGYVTRCPLKSALAAALLMLGPVRDAVTKGTNGTDRASGDAPVLRDAGEPGDGGSADAPLRFTAICPGSNSVSLALAWATNFSPARAWLELHWDTNLLSAGWNPLVAREIAMGETNAAFEVSVSNIPPPAAFYRAYVDTLEISIGGCGAYMREDGTRLHVATRTGSFPVSLSRPDRPAGLSAPDPVFAANPFAYTEGLSYDTDSGTLHVASNGTYRLPDGSELFVSSEPAVTFGIPHAYSGPEYPLDSPALREGWTKGDSPLTGCSCVPEADFGDGIVVTGRRSPPVRSGGGQGGLPDGMRIEWEYEPGGVWATCLAGTNVVWRKWVSHDYLPDYGGRSDGLDGPEEDECGCGDGAEEGPSLGSVRFRIPLGLPYAGITSGFVYFCRTEEFAPTPSAFRLMARGDASVSDTTEDGVRTVACHDFRGRTLVMTPVDGEDAVEIEVRNTASGSLQHTWRVERGYDGGMTFEKTSILGNTMERKTISAVPGGWEERDEIGDVTETRSVREEDGVTREERVVECGGTVVSHVVTDSAQVGSGANAVMRQVARRELGADGAWKTAHATYWNDPAHALRHGCLRLVSGDDRPWSYTAYDDAGRETFRLEQLDGSAAPADSAGYSLSNLPQGVDAFATVFGYEPPAGDSAHTNDFRRARTESRYAVVGGAATLVSRTWRRYVHSETNGLPVVTVVTVRACSQSAGMDDPGNAVSSETAYDAESGLVPYVLRGRPVWRVSEDGVETRYGTEVLGDVVRTVERRLLGGVEAKTRRVSEIDFNHGNLLYEAEALSADGTEFRWREHVYDEKNRLRYTAYDDGSSETNHYSCCRLLWSADRHGARRVRHAQTGTDHLEHAFVDESVKDLPKDEGYHGPWNHRTFRRYSPVTVHRFDGIGRETNTVVRTGRIDNGTLSSETGVYSGPRAESSTTYPQGVSDVSESVGLRGLVTRRRVLCSQSCEKSVEEETEPGEETPSVVVTNIALRGGGEIKWRGVAGRGIPAASTWTCRRRFSKYGADGRRADYDVTESPDGVVTNSVAEHDFLGRVVRLATPASSEVREYDGALPRVLSTLDEVSGVAVTNLYDEAGEQVGTVSGGVEETRRTDYAFLSNAWWRVERSARVAGGATNSPSATWTRLTGLSDALRSEVVEFRGGAFARRTATAYDADAGTERETVSDAAFGESWTVSKFGYPIETGTPTHTVANFYGPVGKVFTRTLSAPGESTRRVEEIEVDALGDEICRVLCDRTDIENAPESHFAYDCRGNRCVVTNAAGAATFASHDPDGNVVAESGATYPTEADYDTEGRRTALRTTRGGTAWDETSWGYDAATGACTNKTYADGSTVSYTHTADGLPLRTTYVSGRWKENAYDSRRQLVQVSHSDSSLDYAMVRDAFGRATNVADAAGSEWRYEYDAFDAVLREEAVMVGRDAPIATPTTAAITRSFDSAGRPTGLALSVDGTPKGSVGYEYGDDGLLVQVVATNAQGRTFSVAYSNHAGRCIGYAITTQGGDTIRRAVTRDFYRRDLINGISTTFNDSSIDSLPYTYDALSRPTARNSDVFDYNERGEVISAQIGTNLFAHAYDFIGNQTNFVANAATNSYTHNALNQLVGRDGDIAPQAVMFAHDPDGNLTNDCTFAYSYDAENRLASVASNGVVFVSNQYDYRGRRIRKSTPTAETTFTYDGWNLIHETVATIQGAITNTTEIQYFWGMDLSETMQGAGGVGGLLAVSSNGSFYFPAYDNNGNITKYIDESGNIVAAYEYDDFGRLISQTGSLADFFRIRFSSKYYGSETGLYYYGYRFYSPSLMRWLNRDPIEEKGGLNLYCFCLNNALPRVDAFGQSSIADYVLGNIGYDRSFPILGPYGIPIPAIAARLQIQIYISGNYAECCKNGKKKKYAKGTVGAEAYLTWGAGTSRQVKGRDRNKPDPYRPGSKMKNNSTNPPDSGYRSRSWHVDGTLQNTSCPESGLHFSGLTGVIFLRGSAGYGAGVQVNIQKEFRAGVDLSRGWSASLNGAWNVWGATIDFGGGGSGSWTYLQD